MAKQKPAPWLPAALQQVSESRARRRSSVSCLNGYKIAGPTVLARIPHDELEALFTGYGYKPYFVEGNSPEAMHQQMAETLDSAIAEINRIQAEARSNGFKVRPPLANDHSSFPKRMDGSRNCR